MPQQAATRISCRQRHLPQMAAAHTRNAVVLREPLVEKRIVRVEQRQDAAVLEHHRGEESPGFLPQ